MTDATTLLSLAERAAPSRWVAGFAAFGAMIATGLAGHLLHDWDVIGEAGEDFVDRLGLVVFFLTWLEIRRPKYVAAALRAQAGEGA